MKDILGRPITHDIFGNPLRSSRKKRAKKKAAKKTTATKSRSTIYRADKDEVLRRQKSLCAGPHCAERHNGKRVAVNISSDFDHIKPVALGGTEHPSNLQALCPNCHREKTRIDRKNISVAKKENEVKNKKKTKRKKSNDRVQDPLGLRKMFQGPRF